MFLPDGVKVVELNTGSDKYRTFQVSWNDDPSINPSEVIKFCKEYYCIYKGKWFHNYKTVHVVNGHDSMPETEDSGLFFITYYLNC